MKWILYDIGGVIEIVDDDHWPDELIQRWSVRVGLSSAALTDRLGAADLPDTTLNTGVAEDYWRGFGAALDIDEDVVAAMRAELWDAYCGQENSELLEHARSLRGRAGLAILSNSADGAREEEERRFGLAAIFDPICYSHEQGVAKPDVRAYRTALTRMGAEPVDVLFIDDHDSAVQGALECGLTAIRHRDNVTTITAIEAFLAG